MRAIALLLGALAAGVTSGCSQPPPTTTADLVLHGATVIDGDGATHGVADVVVGGELISDVTSTCQHPPGAEVIDLAGLYILPGFVDMHAHLVEHGRDEDGSIPPRIDWPLVRRSLRLLVQHGVLTVRDMLALTRKMFEHGVRLVVGTDSPTAWIVPGASFHDEMTLLRDAGIPEPDVLRMATSEGARALGLDQEIGFVQPGYRADIVVLNSNPLERIENTRSILMVVQAGRVVEDGRGVGPLGARTPR